MVFRVHSALREAAGSRRRLEWDLALRDLNHDAPDDGQALTVYQGRPAGIQLAITGLGADPIIAELTEEALSPHFRAYDDIIRGIAAASSGDGMRSLETLDYAKKLIHDEAGELVQEALEDHVELDLATARRLFTLMFLISTQLPERLVTFHRVHR